jgi:hypothetical protein
MGAGGDGEMVKVYEGVVKDNTVVLDPAVRLPEGARVEVRVDASAAHEGGDIDGQIDPFEAVLKHRATYRGGRIGIDEIIEEEKQDREERFDHWLLPEP